MKSGAVPFPVCILHAFCSVLISITNLFFILPIAGG